MTQKITAVTPRQRTDEEWGKELRLLRKELGETQDKFGDRFEATAQAVSYWEAGTYRMPTEIVVWLITGQMPSPMGIKA